MPISYRTGKLVNGRLELSPPRTIEPATCPHFIMVPEHYRPNGTCRCNDASHTEMRGWGYTWKKGAWR